MVLVWPLAMSQSRVVLSELAVARVRPSGLNASPLTRWLCPVSARRRVPSGRSHNFAFNQSPLARVRPSGLKARPFT
jgi:hypothetical protein